MPTLIRLLIIVLVLGGLAYGGMYALVALVEPAEEEVTLRIPARNLMPAPERDPLVRREIDTSRTADSPPPAEPTEPAPGDAEVVTLSPGIE